MKKIRSVIILFIVLVLYSCSIPGNSPDNAPTNPPADTPGDNDPPNTPGDNDPTDTPDGNDPPNTPDDNDPPDSQTVLIHAIQGSGSSSPKLNDKMTVEAIVTADFEGSDQLKGFYIQEEDDDNDNNSLTSEGIFVYVENRENSVSVGDKVRITAAVKEQYSMTALINPQITVLSNGNTLPSVTEVNLPFAAAETMEAYEGMLVKFPQVLTVTDNYDLGRYGSFLLSSGGRLMNPTNQYTPGSSQASALRARNDLNQIIVDDASTRENPDPIVYPSPGLSASNTLRVGYTVTGLTGVVHFSFSRYRIQPTAVPSFTVANTREANPPSVGSSSIKVASFNVLNYFNGNGSGGGFPAPRGATSTSEFTRQRDKVIDAILKMNADIIGLMEIENDGYGSESAIQDLVNGLNASAGSGITYAFINPNASGNARIGGADGDAIAVGLLYRRETISTVGSAAILDASVDVTPRFNDDKNRPALAQTFRDIGTNGELTVVVNHLKSKGSSCKNLGDPDTKDGQGNCNLTRKAAARAILAWLGTEPTGSDDTDFLVIGDLNSYAKEDPIKAFLDGGYTDLIARIAVNSRYTYVYKGESGYLDHALASSSLVSQVTGTTIWHINADEPRSLDYNTEYKSPSQQSSLYSSNAYRSSDHDPVIVGLNLNSDSDSDSGS